MHHKSPAKQLRSIKRITKFIERKDKNILLSPVGIVPPQLGRSCPDIVRHADLQITLENFKLLLESENKKRAEERKLERIEDLRKLELLLALPITWDRSGI